MPATINGIGTHYYGAQNRSARVDTCKFCRRSATLSSYDTREWFCLIFIPVIPMRKFRILNDCSSCRKHHRIPAGEFAQKLAQATAPLRLASDASLRSRCAALCYGYTFDAEEASKKFGFVNATAGKSADDLPQDVPLFVALAGRDEMPRLNETLDDFLMKAVARNLPLTFANHPTGPHALDLFDDSDTSRQVVQQILAFLAASTSRRRAPAASERP